MSGRVAIGVVGCGFFARNHLHSWKDLAPAGADLVAVCDLDAGKAKAAAEAFGVPHFYTDAETMFREQKLGLVDIVTRMDTHRALAEMAFRHGVPAIVQKPFAPDWRECVAIVEAAEKAGLFLAVHENFRFQTPLEKVKAAIGSGAIGDPSWARISFRTGYDIYAGQPYFYDEKRFVILDLGVHVVDVARFLLGEVERVSCETQRRNPKVRAEDTATMLLRHTSGAVSVVEATYETKKIPDSFPETLVEIEGPDGAIVTRPGYRMEVTAGGRMTATDIEIPMLSWAKPPWHMVEESVFKTCAHFLECLQAGREAATSGRDNLKTYAICEAAYESAATGKAVRPAA
ncbi:MAG TPA: Gfo/Idh/MocA family oxidoreductase [Propylenella sp.]